MEYSENAGDNQEIFDTWEFYKNRLRRILPLHYLGIVAGLIFGYLTQHGFNASAKIGSILSMFAVTTWVLPYVNFNPNIPSWTISTLFFWYWCFPLLLPKIQRLSDKEIAYGIVKNFWLEIGLALLVYIGFGSISESYVR